MLPFNDIKSGLNWIVGNIKGVSFKPPKTNDIWRVWEIIVSESINFESKWTFDSINLNIEWIIW